MTPNAHHLSDGSIILGLEPLDNILLMNPVVRSNPARAPLPLRHTGTRTAHDAVEIHSVNTDGRVVLDSQINVLGDSETKVAGLGKVALAEFVFLDFEATLEDFFGFGTADGDMDGNLFVTTDTEGSDCVTGFA